MSSSACVRALDVLQTNNVNDSMDVPHVEGKTDGFELDAESVYNACLQLPSDPFNTFCLIPDPDNTLRPTMCSLATQTNHPNAIFELMIRGELTHPDQLPSLWEGARFQENPAWVDVPGDFVHETTRGSYLGLPFVPAAQDMATNADCSVLHLVSGGQLYESQSDGFVRPVMYKSAAGQILPVAGANTMSQTVVTSSNAAVRGCMFSNMLYLYLNGAWMHASLSPRNERAATFTKILLWQTPANAGNLVFLAVLFAPPDPRPTVEPLSWQLNIYRFSDTATNTPATYETPLASFGQTVPNVSQMCSFLTIMPPPVAPATARLLLVGTTPSTVRTSTFVHCVDVHSLEQMKYNFWELTNPALEPPLVTVRNGMGCAYVEWETFPVVATTNILLRVTMDSIHAFVRLTPNRTVDYFLVVLQSVYLAQTLDQSKRLFNLQGKLYTDIRAQNPLVVTNQPFSLDDNVDILRPPIFLYVFCLASNGSNAWIFRNGTLFQLSNQSSWGTQWLQNFNLYCTTQARCSDFGSPSLDRNTYTPSQSTWYFGTVTKATAVPLVTTTPYELVRSKHNVFRLVVSSIVRASSSNFAYAKVVLQRANEFAIFHAAQEVRLFDDSNVRVKVGTEVVWESFTHDRASSPVVSVVVDPSAEPFAASSSNGFYLLYCSQNNRMRLVFNTFNADNFGMWCSANQQLLGLAISAQSNFCWANLKSLKDEALFADRRCSCIGGERLFDIVAPQAKALPNGLQAIVSENLPCITTGCDFGTSSALNNVRRYFALRCGNRSVTICDKSLGLGNGTRLINANLVENQECFVNQSVCTVDSDCGPGCSCSNGICQTKCRIDADCDAFYAASDSRMCVFGSCVPSNALPTKNVTPMMVVALVLSSLFIVLVLVFVGVAAHAKYR